MTDQPTIAMVEPVPAPQLGAPGEPCRGCSVPLAADQRYCLNCGTRRGDRRVPLAQPAPAAPSPVAPPVMIAAVPPEDRGSLILLAGLGVLLLALAVGVLIGEALGGDDGAGATPQVVTVAQQPTATTAAATEFKPDWPGGVEGWTVQLRTLPAASDAAAITAAKNEATAKGATGVGALRSDDYPTLTAGSFVIYSGQHSSGDAAKTALAGLEAAFPGAAVVRVANTVGAPASKEPASPSSKGNVTQQELEQQQNLSPEEFQKKSKKLPDEIESQGTPPPTDAKPAGGGSTDTEEIG